MTFNAREGVALRLRTVNPVLNIEVGNELETQTQERSP